MPRVVHVVVTSNFAGVERYVVDTANELARRGWDVVAVGGKATAMPRALGEAVRWLPGANAAEAFRSLAAVGASDVCHAHMTMAEATAVLGRVFHRAPVVATRHFAAPRGSTPLGRALAPAISRGISREIAASAFIASSTERPPAVVLRNGVPKNICLWRQSSRTVLVLQRLEQEKDTLTALRAWQASRLWEEGWSMRIVGEGAQRVGLEAWAAERLLEAVSFGGWVTDVGREFARAGVLLATATAEPYGLSVVEAMAAGVPVVASAAGGHLETAGRLPNAPTFPPGDHRAAAAALRAVLPPETRRRLSGAGRELVESELTVERHVDCLVDEYTKLRTRRSRRSSSSPAGGDGTMRELVVCSLEAWDDVWRRNQFFADILLRRHPQLRVLFVEPPTDPLYDLVSRRLPSPPRMRTIGYEGRLRAMRPVKILPRRAGPAADRLLMAQVLFAVRRLNYRRPMLWLNDVTYAPLLHSTRWPAVYDITDDWLAAPASRRERDRLEALEQVALGHAEAVVACSHTLAERRKARRDVVVVSNAVDLDHFRRPRPRPADLPLGPIAVYIGTLHESRLDVDLLIELARSMRALHVILVGPDCLDRRPRRTLLAEPNVVLLGKRPYRDIPAYLQHADVVVVPHLVNEFTESLDPIKAYECVASGRPTVATPVAGFRSLDGRVTVAARNKFVEQVRAKLASNTNRPIVSRVPDWESRVDEFQRVLERASIAARR